MSQSMNVRGGGNRNLSTPMQIAVVPDATLQALLVTMQAAGTTIEDRHVVWTFSNNYEVTVAAANGWPDGRIIMCASTLNSDSVYELSCLMWSFTDSSGTRRPLLNIEQMKYSGSAPSLQDPVENISATEFYEVQTSASAYPCAVVGVDVKASGYCDVLIG